MFAVKYLPNTELSAEIKAYMEWANKTTASRELPLEKVCLSYDSLMCDGQIAIYKLTDRELLSHWEEKELHHKRNLYLKWIDAYTNDTNVPDMRVDLAAGHIRFDWKSACARFFAENRFAREQRDDHVSPVLDSVCLSALIVSQLHKNDRAYNWRVSLVFVLKRYVCCRNVRSGLV